MWPGLAKIVIQRPAPGDAPAHERSRGHRRPQQPGPGQREGDRARAVVAVVAPGAVAAAPLVGELGDLVAGQDHALDHVGRVARRDRRAVAQHPGPRAGDQRGAVEVVGELGQLLVGLLDLPAHLLVGLGPGADPLAVVLALRRSRRRPRPVDRLGPRGEVEVARLLRGRLGLGGGPLGVGLAPAGGQAQREQAGQQRGEDSPHSAQGSGSPASATMVGMADHANSHNAPVGDPSGIDAAPRRAGRRGVRDADPRQPLPGRPAGHHAAPRRAGRRGVRHARARREHRLGGRRSRAARCGCWCRSPPGFVLAFILLRRR